MECGEDVKLLMLNQVGCKVITRVQRVNRKMSAAESYTSKRFR